MTAIHHSPSRGAGQMQKEFYDHLVVFLVVNAVLCALDVLTGTDKLWFYWVLGGWGIGLAAHALRVFGLGHDQPQRHDQPQATEGSSRSQSPQDDNPTGV